MMRMNDMEAKQQLNPLVIYHGNCADGFSAAWCFHHLSTKLETNFDFHPGVYNEDPPDCTDRVVYLVDFSYKREVIEEILNVAKFVYLIDHHKTAIEDLACFYDRSHQGWEERFADKFFAYVDLDRSGAMLAWDFLNNVLWEIDGSKLATKIAVEYKPHDASYVHPPKLLEHVQDRDLWRFKLPGTREIQAAMFSYEYSFQNWDAMMLGWVDNSGLYNLDVRTTLVEQLTALSELKKMGSAIERKHHKDIAELVKVSARWMLIGHIYMPVANLPYTMASDACHLMASTMVHPNSEGPLEIACVEVAACYYDTPEHRVFSLRSLKDSTIDVSEIAKGYGGGGHKHAAGFKVKRSHWLATD